MDYHATCPLRVKRTNKLFASQENRRRTICISMIPEDNSLFGLINLTVAKLFFLEFKPTL